MTRPELSDDFINAMMSQIQNPPVDLPSPAFMRNLIAKLEEVIIALNAHPQFQPVRMTSLYEIWDFVNRSKYMLSEVDNIKNGRPLAHPDQFRPAPGTGEAAAAAVVHDVAGRSNMTKMMTTPGMTATTGLQYVDVGPVIKQKVEELCAASIF